MKYYTTEEDRQKQLQLISQGYEENKGLHNYIHLDIDGKYIVQHPEIDEDADLQLIRDNVSKFILAQKTTHILFVANMHKTIDNKTMKCIVVHMCNPDEENMYVARCKKKGSRKFLGDFEKIDFGGTTKGLFGDFFSINKKISEKEII
jgi:hypothetical protein